MEFDKLRASLCKSTCNVDEGQTVAPGMGNRAAQIQVEMWKDEYNNLRDWNDKRFQELEKQRHQEREKLSRALEQSREEVASLKLQLEATTKKSHQKPTNLLQTSNRVQSKAAARAPRSPLKRDYINFISDSDSIEGEAARHSDDPPIQTLP